MSYSHDIALYKDFDRAAFAAAVEDIRTLISDVDIELAGPSGRPCTRPILNPDLIGFNGVNNRCRCDRSDPAYYDYEHFCPAICRDRRRDLWSCGDDSQQSFYVDVRPGQPQALFQEVVPDGHPVRHSGSYRFDFKTRYRPYDLVVMLAMLALKHHLGTSAVMGSSARWAGDWKYWPVDVYERAFPERAPVQNILDESDEFSVAPPGV